MSTCFYFGKHISQVMIRERFLFCLNKTAFFITRTNFFDGKNAFYDHDFMTETPLFCAIKAFMLGALLVEL